MTLSNTSFPQQNIHQAKQKKQLSLFQEIMLMIGEILFLVFVFLFLLCVANYFSLIHLARSFPQLAFLPHKEQSKQISPPSHLLQQYLFAAVSQKYLPRETLIDTRATFNREKTRQEYSWEIPSTLRGTITFTYIPQTAILKGYTILLTLEQQASSTPLTLSDAHVLITTYFQPITFSPSLHCFSTKTLSVCSSFQATDEGKVGFSLQKSFGVLTLLFCNVPKENVVITTCLDPNL